MNLALRIDELTKVYTRRSGFFSKSSARVVDRLSLRVTEGEVYGFLGMNGAGKTTTIKMLMGFISKTGGELEVFGERVGPPAVRRHIGFAPERAAFHDYLTAGEVLEYIGGLSGLRLDRVRARIPELLRLVSLEGKENLLVKQFSKGMQQRLGIAQSLLGDPRLLVFDEPTTGLDPLGRRMFKELVLRLKSEGRTVFFSSHQLADVQEICDRVGIIHQGRLVHEGLVSELVADGTPLEQKFVQMVAKVEQETGVKTRLE